MEYQRRKNRFTVDLLFDLYGLVCFANKTKLVSCHTADSKAVKQEVIGTVILSPLVFPATLKKTCFFCRSINDNGTALFKICYKIEYQHLLLPRDIWWSKF